MSQRALGCTAIVLAIAAGCLITALCLRVPQAMLERPAPIITPASVALEGQWTITDTSGWYVRGMVSVSVGYVRVVGPRGDTFDIPVDGLARIER
jgi:hypothetical protein